MSENLSQWYALAVYTRQERSVHAEIVGLGVEAFLPMLSVRRLWSDRIKKLQQPLFPGYLFIRSVLTPDLRVKLIRLKQVIDFVGRNKTALAGTIAPAIPEAQIDSLRVLVASEKALEPTQNLTVGTEVRVSSGALKGAFGIIERAVSGQHRIVVQVPLLGRGVRVELSAEDVLSLEELGI